MSISRHWQCMHAKPVLLAACGLFSCLTASRCMCAPQRPAAPSKQKAQTQQPILRGISPEVVVNNAAPATIRLQGKALDLYASLWVLDCDQKRTELKVNHPQSAVFTITLPVSLLKACVLRILTEGGNDFGTPLGVADPAIARLKTAPGYVSGAGVDWGGKFNYAYSGADLPGNSASVGIDADPSKQHLFVLGKHNTPLFRVYALKAPTQAGQVPASIFDLVLPGVDVRDVDWSGDDEVFWIGTISADGTTVEHRRLLSTMTDEPSGSRDQI